MLLVGGSLGLGTWTAVAQTVSVPSSPSPLPGGSQFQGGDGDQDNATGLIDWQGMQASGRVGHTSDPNKEDDSFTSSKELEPDGWELTTHAGGASPPKGNVLDSYRVLDHPLGGDAFVYLAFAREAGNGTVSVSFELNQDPRRWTNSRGTTIPCRTTGDLLISFGPQGNGAEVVAEEWVTDTAADNGCAETGDLRPASVTPNTDVQASFNSAGAINNHLPGFNTAQIGEMEFGEAAINLSAVMADLGRPCAVFGSTWMHSRSSLQEVSDMKDYVVPEAFHVRTCKASPALSSSASGAVDRGARGPRRLWRHRVLGASTSISDTAILSGGDQPSGTITFKLYGPDDAECSRAPLFTSSATVIGNGAYQSGAATVTRVGTYRWVVEYSGGQNNNAAGPTPCGTSSETVIVSRATPSVSSTASGSRRRGSSGGRQLTRASQPIYDTALLADGIAPTGELTFLLYGPDDATCAGGAIFRSVVTVNGNGPYSSEPFTPTAAGTFRWVVRYSGDENNRPVGPTDCNEPLESSVVSPARPTIFTVASGAVPVGEPISDLATLSGGAAPRGTITFRVYGPDDDDCTAPAADSSTVSVSGDGDYPSDPFVADEPGTYRWIAAYSGDRDNQAVTTSCDDPGEAVVVAPTPPTQPTLTTTASAPVPAGSPIQDTARLSGGAAPTGTITFKVFGPDNGNCTAPAAHSSSVSVSGNGDYPSEPFRPAVAGTYRWVASYSGDEHNLAAGPTACADAAERVVVSKVAPALRTEASRAVPVGRGVWDTAVLSGGAEPRGAITFKLYGPDDSACAGPPVFSVEQAVVGNGRYRSATFAPQQAGNYLWIATYSGDGNNAPALTGCGDADEAVVGLPRRLLMTTSASPPANLGNGRRVGVPASRSTTPPRSSSGSRRPA